MCRLANCERFFARCEITETGLAQCVCPEVEDCPVEDDEVCASDKKTYATECHMRAQACASKTPLRVEKKGPCGMCYCGEFVDTIRKCLSGFHLSVECNSYCFGLASLL